VIDAYHLEDLRVPLWYAYHMLEPLV